MDPAKLKVVELRAELSQRGLDTKGNKAVLVERLRKALEDNDAEEATEAPPAETNDNNDASSQDEREKTPEPSKPASTASKTPSRSSRSQSSPKASPTKASPRAQQQQQQEKQLSPVKSPIVEKQPPSPVIDQKTEAALLEEDEPENVAAPQTAVEESSEPPKTDSCTPQVAEEAPEIPVSEQQESVQKSDEELTAEVETPVPVALDASEEPDTKTQTPPEVPQENQTDEETSVSGVVEKIENEQLPNDLKENDEKIDEKIDENNDDKVDVNVGETKMEVNEHVNENNEHNEETNLPDNESKINEIKQESSNLDSKEEKDNAKSEIDNETNEDVEMKLLPTVKEEDEKECKDQDRRDRKDRKRKRSTSSERPKSPQPVQKDDEPEIDCSRVLLSWYDSDLNLVIDKSTFLSATPMHSDGFGYVWAGARASFGFSTGKVYYEIKIKHHCSLTITDEEYPHVLRAGWSVSGTSMQLGEEKFSYGYGGTGKISTANNFKDFGSKFGLNDILGCYLDMSGDDVSISYTLNGKDLGQAFTFPKSDLEDKPLFPHILTKNCEFICNFGDEEPWCTPIEGFVAVGQVDIKDRVPGPVRPQKREDCQMLMLCGLPGSGKTYWATKYALEHPDKMYNVLGTNSLIDKMKVIGLPRKRNYHGRWEVLIDKCTRCLNKLLDVAATRRRNYILDQTNVYPSAQRRKMKYFHGFQRKAIVIVPTEEEFKSRTAKREAVEGKEVPDSAILEMKANFAAPVVGESFDCIEWVELGEEEAKKLIVKYNKEGKDAGYAQQQTVKRPRFEKNTDSHRSDSRDNRSSRDNNRDSRDHRDRRNPYSDRNRNSSWRGGGSQMSGGWRDRGPRGGSMRQSSGGYGSPGGWRPRTGGPSGPMHRSNDRRGPANDRRSGMNDRRSAGPVRQGGWGPMNSSNYHNSGSSSGGWGGSSQGGGGGGGGAWSSGSATSGSSGNWGGNGQGSWAAQQGNWAGNWKGYGSNANYNSTAGYNQQSGYGNGNWGSWNQQQQYYNQYWSQQPSAGGQSNTTSGQSSTSGGSSTTAATAVAAAAAAAAAAAPTTNAASSYNSYPGGWQGYTQSYSYSTDGSNANSQQQK